MHSSRLQPFLFLVALAAGCGPGTALEPLVGEDQLAFEIADTDGMRLFDDAPSIRARELVGTLDAGLWRRAWDRLGPTARRVVEDRTGAKGPAALDALIGAGAQPVDLLVGLHPVRITVIPPEGGELEPPSSFVPADGRVTVYAYGADGSARALTMLYEEGDWRLDVSEAVKPSS